MTRAEQETPRWRLTIDGAHGGAANMARDEALRESVMRSAGSPPILRLYGWQPPCLSLGYGQRARLVDEERCRARGWQVVRRPSGGGALLHAQELTYCLLLPPRHPLQQGDILSSYARLRRGLVAGLAHLGVCADATPVDATPPEPNRSEPICYLQPAAQEITVGGRKLIGSAQLRRRGVLLQHGSLPLAADITVIADALQFDSEAERAAAKEKLRQGAVSLAELLPERTPGWSEAAAALAAGFAAAFGILWDEQPFSAAEEARARAWAEARYATAAWTERR